MFENIDNRTKILGDDLKKELKQNSKVRIAASCFSMYAFKELKEELSQIEELKFLFTSPTFTKDKLADNMKKEKREFFIPKQARENSLYGNDFEIKLRNEMTLKAIAKECAEWVKNKVKFKSNITEASIPNIIGIEKPDGVNITYNPIDGFTTSDLGYQQGNTIFSATMKTDFAEQSKFLFSMFDEIWNDKSKVEDITDTIVEMIGNAYQENSPEFIYLVVLYNIFSEFLDDITEDNMPNEATGFKDTKIWNMLYDFQKDGVISIINKLEKHNGCILADSVGLGKTFTALAVIAYYSLRNKSILVLCPKRLSSNWTQYCGNETTNIFYKDRIRYEVLYHTDLGRAGVAHNGRDLRLVNWGNYDLVVIDESHNFRNNNPVKDKETRYDFLINHVIKEGVKTKVLMLSATPVNNRYNDLKNQLALAYAQDYDAFEKSLDTKSNIEGIVFWSKNPKPMLEQIGKLNGFAYYFLYTLNAYPEWIEGGLPPLEERINTFKELSKHCPVIWRYDPILIADDIDIDWHLEKFKYLCESLKGYTKHCKISFVIDTYSGCSKSVHAPSEKEKRNLVSKMTKTASKNGIFIETCADFGDWSEFGVLPSRCIDGYFFEELLTEKYKNLGLKVTRKSNKLDGQRKNCGCMPAVDIGRYDTCKHGCNYCYARKKKSTTMYEIPKGEIYGRKTEIEFEYK